MPGKLSDKVALVTGGSSGMGKLTEPLAEVTPDSFDQLFGLNVRGTLFTAQKAAARVPVGGRHLRQGQTPPSHLGPGRRSRRPC
jgi:NAD(P)-dependent dehydrogenase (short-subunit alcohol dehydrogenase family)